MAEIKIDYEGKTPIELLGQGIRSYAIRDFDTSVAYLSKASELANIEKAPDEILGDIYLYYGKALLEVSREETNPLGDALPQVESSDDDGIVEDTNLADTAEKGKEQDKPEDAKVNGVSDSSKEKNENKLKGDDEKTESAGEKTEDGEQEVGDEVEGGNKAEGDEAEGGDKAEGGDQAEGGDEAIECDEAEAGTSANQEEKIDDPDKQDDNDELTDLQLAWEVLELARVIYEKNSEKHKSDLVDCYITLGEVSLESETFENGIRDIKQGLEIQQTILADDDRALAETYYKLGVAYGMNNQHDDAINCYTKSKEILQKKMENTTDKKESEEIKELIPEIDEKIVDMKNLKDEVRVAKSCRSLVNSTIKSFEELRLENKRDDNK